MDSLRKLIILKNHFKKAKEIGSDFVYKFEI